MRIVIALLTLLTVQTSLSAQTEQTGDQEFVNEVMRKGVTKSVSDRQILREQYQFDVIKNQKTSGNEGASDSLSIEELFGRVRYRYEMDYDVPLSLSGRPVYLINFFPESDNQPDAPKGANQRGKIKNEILNHLRGTVYVDQDDFGIVRVVTHANNPPEKIFIVGRLYSMESTLEQDRLGEIWVPREIVVKAEFSYFLGWHHSHDNTSFEFYNFRLKAP